MIGRMSFGQMKPLLSCSIAEEAIACGDALMSGSCEAVSVRDGKGHVSLCSRDVFPMKKKGPSYCWGPETAFEKKKAKEKIDALNKELETYLPATMGAEHGD